MAGVKSRGAMYSRFIRRVVVAMGHANNSSPNRPLATVKMDIYSLNKAAFRDGPPYQMAHTPGDHATGAEPQTQTPARQGAGAGTEADCNDRPHGVNFPLVDCSNDDALQCWSLIGPTLC